MVSSRAVGASEFVFPFILLPILVQSNFKCLDVWCLHNIVWETVPVVCVLNTKEIVVGRCVPLSCCFGMKSNIV